MFKHYLLLSFRNIKRTKTSFFVNLIGLSTGLACAVLIFLWVYDEMNIDRFHDKNKQLFSVMQNIEMTKEIVTLEVGPNPIAQTLVEEMPEVESAVSVFEVPIFGKPNLSFDDNKIKANCLYAGRNFFNIFSYNLIEGIPNQIFRDVNSIAISDEVAMKLFNTTRNVIGQTLKYQNESQFIVSGIFKSVPSNSSMQFDFVLSNDLLTRKYPSMNRWQNNTHNIYVILNQGTNIAQFNDKIASLIERKCGESNRKLFLKPYSERYLYGTYENGVQVGGRIEYVRMFSIIAVFILVMGCINFINLSTAKASERVREIGMQKVFGASRRSLIFQYLGESLLMAFLSLLTAIILIVLFLPRFNEITGKHIMFNFNSFHILFFLIVTLVTGLIAGSYPALYFSAFNPVTILKRQFHGFNGELWTRKVLVVFQFVLSIILIVSVLVIYKQFDFIQNKNLGFDIDDVIYFDMEGRVLETGDAFLSEIKNIPGIVNASSTMFNIIGEHNITGDVNWEGKNPDDNIDFHMQFVNYDFIETLGIKMKEGRTFSKDFSADNSKIICNETAIDIMGLKDPIDNTVTLWGEERQIIGVTYDFNFESLHKSVDPLIFVLAQPSQNLKIIAKIESGTEIETIDKLKKFYENYNPEFVFEYTFLDDENQALYASERRAGILSRYFAVIAIIISCLGLFGLTVFSSERRTKEIGIRKVFGSSAIRIVYILSIDFTILLVLSIFIALPLSYLITKDWLNEFAYRIQLEWWYFIGSGLLALIIAWFTVGTIAIKTANINPSKCLREE